MMRYLNVEYVIINEGAVFGIDDKIGRDQSCGSFKSTRAPSDVPGDLET